MNLHPCSNNSDDDKNNIPTTNNNTTTTTTDFVHACTSQLHRLASAILALQRTLPPANSVARQTCQQAHFEAVELLKAILRAEQAGTLGKVLVTRGVDWEGVGLRQQAVLGLRVVWALERWREFEMGVRERQREMGVTTT